MAKEVILTKEGYEKLKQEIEYLSTEKRREVADRIRVAREFGDIAENSEYDDAKNEQALVEHRIALLEERLLSARVIEKKDIAKDVVSVGSTVKLRDMGANKTVEYRIVGSAEANPAEQKLSNESPVGKALIGRKRNDIVSVPVPRGPARKLIGLELEGKRIARQGMPVRSGEKIVGEITSGTFGPTVQKSIAMAYVDSALTAEGTTLDCDLKGTMNPCKIVKMPFYKKA